MIRTLLLLFGRAVIAFACLAVGLWAVRNLWIRYEVEPYTRDGRVRADVVQVAADVGGLVTDVRMRDNQRVRRGDVLLVVDRPRYQLAYDQSVAAEASQRVALAQATREDARNRAMREVVSAETIEQGAAKVDQLKQAWSQAVVAKSLARLNLERTEIRAPVDGVVSNMTLQPGAYLSAGKTAAALLYTRSTRIEGYFEETKLPLIHVGDRAEAHLMGMADPVIGHVESIAAGVEDRDRTDSDGSLANVNPAFTWVRLAQRIPVRIAVDRLPPGVQLIAGQTASVEILPKGNVPVGRRSFPW